jgi:protease PrsW
VPWSGQTTAVRSPRPAWYRLVPTSLAVLITGLTLYLIVYETLVYTGDPLFIPALILVGASTIPAAFAVYVSHLTGATRVSARTLALCALWGGVLGAVVAGVVETGTARALGGLPTPLVGMIEESAKLLVPLAVLLFARHLRHREADGLLIGVAVGVAFAVLETMGYAFVTLLQTRGNLHAMDQLLLVRGLLAPAGHAAWTGLAAAALWRVGIRRTARSAIGFLVTVGLVVALHTTWDSTSGWPWYLGLAAVSLGLLHLRLWRIRRASSAGTAPAAPAADRPPAVA